jgi:hypothetical protein
MRKAIEVSTLMRNKINLSPRRDFFSTSHPSVSNFPYHYFALALIAKYCSFVSDDEKVYAAELNLPSCYCYAK